MASQPQPAPATTGSPRTKFKLLKPAQGVDALKVLSLFYQNLENMRAWYKAARHPGIEVMSNVISESVIADTGVALEYALRGQIWTAPNPE